MILFLRLPESLSLFFTTATIVKEIHICTYKLHEMAQPVSGMSYTGRESRFKADELVISNPGC